MAQPIRGFMNFVREQGVVGLAVGLVLGTAVKGVVDSLVNNIINPLIGLLTGGGDSLAELKWRVGQQTVSYGAFLSTILQFLIIAAIIYYVVTGLKLDRLDKKKDDAEPRVVKKAKQKQ